MLYIADGLCLRARCFDATTLAVDDGVASNCYRREKIASQIRVEDCLLLGSPTAEWEAERLFVGHTGALRASEIPQ